MATNTITNDHINRLARKRNSALTWRILGITTDGQAAFVQLTSALSLIERAPTTELTLINEEIEQEKPNAQPTP